MEYIDTIEEFAAAVKRARLKRKLSVDRAASQAGINRATWKRIEDGLPVQEVSRTAVESSLKLRPRGAPGEDDGGDSLPNIIGRDLNPDLADFSDQELLDEVGRRMIIGAAKLERHGERGVLDWATSMDGERLRISRLNRST